MYMYMYICNYVLTCLYQPSDVATVVTTMKFQNIVYMITYMGMEFFSGEGLDLIFPLGGGAIFQPRGGLGGGAKQQNFS